MLKEEYQREEGRQDSLQQLRFVRLKIGLLDAHDELLNLSRVGGWDVILLRSWSFERADPTPEAPVRQASAAIFPLPRPLAARTQYFRKHELRIQYAMLKSEGLPIGSGPSKVRSGGSSICG